ncbi:SDR family NAD(P)-dependent oxidoreductase [Lentzea flaviverrucosa]|uniref:NAD(P)-dependent dehydrogenase, short-chain alcohol dehydrogenase family n=1 Tax=Lentzea flaviverrucosa TaxID=200379 RepID=A0A1H9A9W4_9PSEU|nr:SDR family NAD(P)-dependent oxidoreductase [Lentzea flaviverrucosa]RDI32127.1 NAD(P)-dependent dehydrogenase (short-subunit alcohol dehydrogenase family) [Lentzea flaviverrucosa]SEP73331.1 NAD(P)-dependent dehydrogenase, short-chain alcohol dehydrogenase family [Lentzea flaviverrucosa]
MSELISVLDTVADRLVVPGYSKWGYRLRRRSWSDLEPGALHGARAVVTGAGSGIGKAAALGLARLGADVVLAVRDERKGETARAEIVAAAPGASVLVRHCDVSSLESVRRFAAEIDRVDVLVHNAGVLPQERAVTAEGHELTFATHVLGPLLMTELLRPLLAASADPRVVLVSSGGMYTQRLRADDPEYREGTYKGATAYARTKRMQVTLVPLLTKRYAADGIAVHGMHPGWADTPGVAGSLPGFHRLTGAFLRTAEEGADTVVWLAATKPAPRAGRFWHDRRERPAHLLPGTAEKPEDVAAFWQYCAGAADLR